MSGGPQPVLPYITSLGFTSLGYQSGSKDPTTIFQLFGDAVKSKGNFTLKFGVDARQYRLDITNYNADSGTFTFGSNFLTATSSAAAPTYGAGSASFLFGLPSSGSFYTPVTGNFHANYLAFFAQNDWRVSSHLTVNMGVRYDHQSPWEDKLSRVVNGFQTNAVNSASTAAAAAYASNPISQVPAASFNTLGGLSFPDTPTNGAQYQTISHWFSPRLGFSYNPAFLQQKLVIRGGYSMFVLPANLDTLSTTDVPGSNAIVNQEGFAATTNYIQTNTNYLTSASTLDNPFPAGLAKPTGSTLGASTYLGSALTFYAPALKDPYALRWNLSTQYAAASNLLIELNYIGDHAVHQPIGSTSLNYIPQQFLSTKPIRDTAMVAQYSSTVPNPFKGLLPGSTLNGSTTAYSNLLMTYPEYTSVTEQNNTVGSSYYHSGSLRVVQRTSHGLSLTANYSFSKLMEKMQYLNAGDTKPVKMISPYDYRQHMNVGATYELPVGHGKLVDVNSRILNSIVGGFTLNGIYTFQTGAPLYFSNDLPVTGQAITNSPRAVTPAKALNTAAFDTASGDQFSNHLRTLPFTFGNVRIDGINQMDSSLLKDVHLPREMYAQIRFEVFNTLNHACFGAPAVSSATSSSFGQITSQVNTSRTIQIGGRFVF
jgi:hypothetical protein